jgi:hypothetical protein
LPTRWQTPLNQAETPLLRQYTSPDGLYMNLDPVGTQNNRGHSVSYRTEAAPPIQSSGSKIIDNAERLNTGIRKASQTKILVKDAIYDTMDIPPGQYDPSLSTALLAGSVWIGARHAQRKLKSWLHEKLRNIDFNEFGDKRERLSRQLLFKGYGTIDGILKASYGVWPPKGLNIPGANKLRVDIGHVSESLGSANRTGPRKINVNITELSILPAFLGQSAVATALGHELTHILQGDFGPRLHDTFGTEAEKMVRHLPYLQSGRFC